MNNIKTAISALNLTKNFGELRAVDNISFKIDKGEIVGILGPNGAGKTTTIRLIAGLFEAEKNKNIEITIFGKDLRENLIECKTKIGIVPEISNAYTDFTVLQNLEFTGRIYGLTKQEVQKRAKNLLNQYDLIGKINVKTKSLSKGLKQRLNFCLALMHDPSILILDEPTSGLDPISVRIMRKNILKMKEKGKTILITTHDMQEAQNICDRVLIMNQGKIITDANPDMLRKNFKQKSTIRFQIVDDFKIDQKYKIDEKFHLKKEKSGYFSFSSEDPLQEIAKLSHIIEKMGIQLTNLTIKEVSLEEVFIGLINNTKMEINSAGDY